ncbi:MAG: UDP-N-acetylglucosamine 2-epimerase (non-hydrolyzing) [Candidatus Bipolaricaulota bacterium]
MKITSVVGARPQFVKLGPICRAFAGVAGIEHQIVHTGQHYDATMSDVFFADLELPAPDVNLGVGSGSHGSQTGHMLARLEEVFLSSRPDLVLVFGDTNSTLAAALAAAKLHMPVAHVEAGLRSFRKSMPEEINRVLADHVSTLLFCPTDVAVENLLREGIAKVKSAEEATPDAPAVLQVGDVMQDAVEQNARHAAQRPHVAVRLGVRGSYAVATVHRAENTDDAACLREIVAGLGDVARDTSVVLPLHPRTRNALRAAGLVVLPVGVHAVEPLSYLDMLQLVSQARLVLTDSGGLQKEAYLLGVPCVTLRDETEWVELVEAGWNQLAGASRERIATAARAALAAAVPPSKAPLYGDGKAAKRVAAACWDWWRGQGA